MPALFYEFVGVAGPETMWSSGWWQAPIDGAGIAAVLFLVDRAFNSFDEAGTGASAGEFGSGPRGPISRLKNRLSIRSATHRLLQRMLIVGWCMRRERAGSPFNSKMQALLSVGVTR